MFGKKSVKIVSTALAVSLTVMMTATAASAADVQQQSQLSTPEQYAVSQGIIQGDGSGNYSFTNNLTEDQLLTILSRAFTSSSGTSGTTDTSSVSGTVAAVGQAATTAIGQTTSVVGQAASSVGQFASSVGQGTSVVGQGTSVVGQAASSVGQAASSVGQAASSVGQFASSVGQAASSVGQVTSSVGQATSSQSSSSSSSYITLSDAIELIEEAAENADITVPSDISDQFTDSQLSNYATKDEAVQIIYYILNGTFINGTSSSTSSTSTSSSISTISYTSTSGDTVSFSSDDFSDAYSDVNSDEDLSYVKFSLPSSAYGTLYYDDSTEVTSSDKYYVDDSSSSTDDISDVSFDPSSSFSGTVYIPYVAYGEDGTAYYGNVKVTVSSSSSSSTLDTITYSADENDDVSFDEDDFTEAFEDLTDSDLSYVKFTLPSSSKGTLYYNSSEVTSSTKYYASKLDDITFDPYSDYTGTVYIYYTAYDSDSNSYTGTIKVTVSSSSSSSALDTITYSADENDDVSFDEDDFTEAFEDLTDSDLSYVKFTLPSSSKGTLYYNSSKVTSSTKYYASKLDDITFDPYSDYTGTVYIYYTAYDSDSNSYTGTIKVTISD